MYFHDRVCGLLDPQVSPELRGAPSQHCVLQWLAASHCLNVTYTPFLLLTGNYGEITYAQSKFRIIMTSLPNYLTITFEVMCVMNTHVFKVQDLL